MTRAERDLAIREWWATHETPKQAAARFGVDTRTFWRVGHPEQARSKRKPARKIRRRWFHLTSSPSETTRVIEAHLTAVRAG